MTTKPINSTSRLGLPSRSLAGGRGVTSGELALEGRDHGGGGTMPIGRPQVSR